MSVIDEALKANELYAKTYDPKWGAGPPKPKLAVVTCEAWILGSPTFPGFSD